MMMAKRFLLLCSPLGRKENSSLLRTTIQPWCADRLDELFEIDDSAYTLMKRHIRRIEIEVQEFGEAQAKESTRLKAGEDGKGKSKAKDTPPASPSSRRETYKQSSSKVKLNNEPLTRADSSRTLSTSSSTARPKPISVSPSLSVQADPHDLFNDDISVEYASPKKKKITKAKEEITKDTPKANPQHIYNVDLDDAEAPPAPQPAIPKSKSKPALVNSQPKSSSSEWEELAAQSKSTDKGKDISSERPKSNPSSRTDEEISLTVKKEKTSKPSSSTAPTKDTKLLPRIDAIAASQPTAIFTQNTDASAQSQDQSQTQTQTQTATSADPEPRFKIKIWGPGRQNGEFMTRKRHTVRKVLAGACKNFGVDPSQAKLQQVFELPDEFTGQIVSHHYDCDNDETVGQAGIGPESTLRVRVDGEEEDEYEEGNSY
ncbi:hypothetical protein J3R30DRAFT_1093777 [Lentinula aciculospora]|uniref:Uncharacterized protein n=1 Tax=Lentinula aciculospora TaxID=153920 RepID=A0A9W9A0E5_9AGAR|nr:hypothetical protein J3R30DRAFT_1093777 [Lentinula aciculospora]